MVRRQPDKAVPLKRYPSPMYASAAFLLLCRRSHSGQAPNGKCTAFSCRTNNYTYGNEIHRRDLKAVRRLFLLHWGIEAFPYLFMLALGPRFSRSYTFLKFLRSIHVR